MKPYRSIEELPQSLRNELPDLARRLYLAVYQRTWETSAMSGIESDLRLANAAHEAAMRAVQDRFDKDEQGKWRQSPVDEEIHPDKLPPEQDSD